MRIDDFPGIIGIELVELRDVIPFAMKFFASKEGEFFSAVDVVSKASVFVKTLRLQGGNALRFFDEFLRKREKSDGLMRYRRGVVLDELDCLGNVARA